MTQTEIEPLRPTARVEHTSPGRVRARVVAPDRSPRQLERVRRQLEAQPAVRAVEVNPQTGSVLVLGSHQVDLRAVLGEALNLVQAARGEGDPDVAAAAIATAVREADESIRRFTNGRLSIKLMVPSLLVGLGVRELFAQGLTLGTIPWWVLIYYGVDSFVKLYPEQGPQTDLARQPAR